MFKQHVVTRVQADMVRKRQDEINAVNIKEKARAEFVRRIVVAWDLSVYKNSLSDDAKRLLAAIAVDTVVPH